MMAEGHERHPGSSGKTRLGRHQTHCCDNPYEYDEAQWAPLGYAKPLVRKSLPWRRLLRKAALVGSLLPRGKLKASARPVAAIFSS